MSAPIVFTTNNPMPLGGHARWLEASDGVRLRAILWEPRTAGLGACRGTVFLFGGRTEFAEKYFEVAGELIGRGFAVATLDWRGQGLSDRLLADPRKGHVDDFMSFGHDLAVFMAEVAPAFPKPWIALAHSMGGNILLRAAHDRPDWFSGLALSAPMLGLRFSGAAAGALTRAIAVCGATAGLGARYVPGGNAKAADEVAFARNILTHDEQRYAAYQAMIRADGRLGLGSATLGWLAAAFRSMDVTAAPAYLGEIETPVLIALAAEDALIDSRSLRAVASGLPDARLAEIAGARHEILIERDDLRAQFWAAFDGFAGRIAPL